MAIGGARGVWAAAVWLIAAAGALAAEAPSAPGQELDQARAACEAGGAPACHRVGLLLEAGPGSNLPLAWKAFHRACRMGSAAACAHRIPTPTDPPAELRRLCDAGFTSRCLALALVRERGPAAGRGEVAPLLRRACLWGTAMGCYLLARSGAERDPGAQAIVYRDACTRGASGGCVELARRLQRGRGVWHDPRTVRWAYQIGCQQGDREACVGLRDPALADVKNSPDDREEAARACAGGDLQACADAGIAFTLGVPADRERAAGMLERSCQGGNQEGCTNLAILDDLRDGGCRRAAPLLDRACAAGVAQACGVRAFRCDMHAPTKDARRIVRDLELGCIGGDQETCEHLSTYRWAGDVIAKDGVEATMLAQNACEDGWTRSCPQAGSYFLTGVPGEPDPRAARAPLAHGCDGGEARSCLFLARMYRDGNGVDRDLARAHALLGAACRLSDEDGCRELRELDIGAGPGEPAEPR